MDDLLSEPRIRQAVKVLENEKRRLAGNLIMSLTPGDQNPSPTEIHEAVATFRAGADHLDAARTGLNQLIPYNVRIED